MELRSYTAAAELELRAVSSPRQPAKEAGQNAQSKNTGWSNSKDSPGLRLQNGSGILANTAGQPGPGGRLLLPLECFLAVCELVPESLGGTLERSLLAVVQGAAGSCLMTGPAPHCSCFLKGVYPQSCLESFSPVPLWRCQQGPFQALVAGSCLPHFTSSHGWVEGLTPGKMGARPRI